MKILVTGGAGFIGSHTILELLNAGHDVIVMDNLLNSKITSLERVEDLTGQSVSFEKLDLLNIEGMDELFKSHSIDAVIHFAGLKAVGESVEKPLYYYENNVTGTVNLCKVMDKYGVKRLVFSSSATVYGNPSESPIKETSELSATNPYGQTKLTIEHIFRDLCVSDPEWKVSLLRYFNPVGAHESGRIGEDPTGIPNNLMPFVSQVAVGRRAVLDVFGDDYETRDGTGERDYIHVVDLARAHLDALGHAVGLAGCDVFNVGTGRGATVLELVRMFEQVTGRGIPYRIAPRR